MKKILTILAGLVFVLTATTFADVQGVSNELLDGVGAATPANWNSENPVWDTGTIDIMSGDGVIINDIGYKWSKYGSLFRDSDGSILVLTDFGPGTEVTFVLDGDRQTIVTLIRGQAVDNNDKTEQ